MSELDEARAMATERSCAVTAVALSGQRRTGARGLRTILENILLDTMYDLPSERNVQKVVVDEQVIEGANKPYLLYRSEALEERRATGSDRTFDNVIMSVDPFTLVLAAFVVAMMSTVFSIGERLQRDTEGLV